MTKTLDLFTDLQLPLNAVTQKLAFLGISGSGKTYGAGKFVEELLEAGAQVVVLDTIGNWYGLRLAADGKKPGYSIPILGGEKGDVPIDSYHGKLTAETVTGTKASIIVDISDFTGGELRRWVTDFATELLRLKKRSPSPVMLIWEECQDIVPQRVMGETAKMVGAVEKLIKKGRNYGIGTVLISQRAAAVNKDVLNQVETLMCFRQNAKHDRKAIEDWIVSKEIDVGSLVEELPSLPTGTCFCWSPQWLNTLTIARVKKKWTFDASATPEFGEEVRTGTLAPVDLEKFKKSMGHAVEQAKANNPEILRKRISELEKENKDLRSTNNDLGKRAAQHDNTKPRTISVIKDGQITKLTNAASKMTEMGNRLLDYAKVLVDEVRKVTAQQAVKQVEPKTFFLNEQHELPRAHRKQVTAEAHKLDSSGELSKCAREILRALASRYPDVLNKTQISTLSGYSQNSSGFANALSELNTAEMIVKSSSGIGLASTGADYVKRTFGDVSAPADGDELLDLWASKLPGKETDILRILRAVGEKGIEREHLAEAANLSPSSSGYANYLSHLNTNGLIRKEHGVIKANELFL